MREGLSEREAPFVDGQVVAEDNAGDFVWRLRIVLNRTANEVEPLLMMTQQLVDAAVEVVEDGTVAGEATSTARP